MTKVTRFHPSHIGALQPRSDVVKQLRECTPDYFATLAAEPSVTIWCDRVPVACTGVVGNCETWAVFDERRARLHKVAVVRAASRFISTFEYLYVNCTVPVDTKLPRLLGFAERPGWRDRCIHLERVA
jgi:hypothetical protein